MIVTGGTPATHWRLERQPRRPPSCSSLSTNPVEAAPWPASIDPGGNLTGVTGLNVELAQKKLEMLHELLPSATIIALLVNPTNIVAARNETKAVKAAAQDLGLQLPVLHASTERDFD